MQTAFENAGKTLQNGYFVTAEFHQGDCGTISIFLYNTLKLGEQSGERVHFEAEGGSRWDGGQEPKGMSDESRRREPYNRGSSQTYIPHGFGQLDILPTSNGSRFLSLKQAWPVGSSFSSVDEWPERGIAVIINEEDELAEYLTELLPRLGVPQDNIAVIREDILNKIHPR